MSKDENKRDVDFPNLGDYEVLEKIQGLRRVFVIHKRILDKTGESYPYYPDEIQEKLSSANIYDLWINTEYETIEELYLEAWIEYTENIFEEYIYFTLEEFLDGSAEIVLKDEVV